jgi:hypothetical protein
MPPGLRCPARGSRWPAPAGWGTAFDAMYDLFFGRWTLLGPPWHLRVGVEIRF